MRPFLSSNRSLTKLFGDKLLRNRQFSSKIPSDEKLLEEILSSNPDEDTDLMDSNGNAAYRKKSSLEQYQSTGTTTRNDPNHVPPIGPKYWKKQFRKSYNNVEKGLTSTLEDYVNRNMDVIESYNKQHIKTVEERISIDFNQDLRWRDVIPNYNLRVAVARYLQSRAIDSQTYTPLTSFQKRFFALMSAHASTIAKGSCGDGKSFSLLLSALSIRRSRQRGKGINTLIIVKSNALVHQYEKTATEILSFMPSDKKFNQNSVIQFLSRGTPEEEMQQEDNLTDFQYPHVLVTTPQRLLDILSSKGMDFVKINSLALVGVDDFTTMLDENLLLEAPKKAPVVKLMDYVMKLQDYRRSHNDPHPQVILLTDDSTTENLVHQVNEYTKWIDWKKFAPIGKFGEEEDIPHYKYVGTRSTVSSVFVLPRFMEDSAKTGKFKISLYDMKPFVYGETPSDWLDTLYRTPHGNAMTYKKHRNSKWSNIPPQVKKGVLEITCAGLGKLLKKKEMESWFTDDKRALVIHPDELNSAMVVEALSKKTSAKVRAFDIKNDLDVFTTQPDEKDNAKLLVVNVSSLLGLTMRSLDTMFVLGIDTIKSEQMFSTIMGRPRTCDGLVPSSEYNFFAKKLEEDEFTPRSRTFIISPMSPDGSVDHAERNFLERCFLANGLIKQLPVVGVEEKWDAEKELEYKRAIHGRLEEEFEQSSIQFGGIYNGN